MQVTRRGAFKAIAGVPFAAVSLSLGGCTSDQVTQAIQLLCGVTADALAIAALMNKMPNATVQQIAAAFCAAYQQQKARLRGAPATVLVNGQWCQGGTLIVNGVPVNYCGTPRLRRR